MQGFVRSLLCGNSSMLWRFKTQTSRRKKSTSLPKSMTAEFLEIRTLLAAQVIASDAPVKVVGAGDTLDIPVVYKTTDDSGSNAALKSNFLAFNLHFDANALTYVSTSNIFAEGLEISPNSTRSESDASVIGDDNNTATETVLLARFSDSDANQNPGWPNAPDINGQILYVAHFTVNPGFSGSVINFSANGSGAVTGQSSNFTFRGESVVLENSGGPTVSISDAPLTDEGSNAVFTVTLSEAQSQPVTVNYSTEEGNGPSGALAGEDFVAKVNQTLTFAAGETSKTISIQTIDDSEIDPEEVFEVKLSNAVGADIGNAFASVTIKDNDGGGPSISISNSALTTEGQNATFTVSLNQAAASTVTVKYSTRDGNGPTGAMSGSDYTSVTDQLLTFSPGQTSKTISIVTLDDAANEGEEEFEVVLSSPTGAIILDGVGLGIITDNDSGLPNLSISDAAAVSEGGAAVFTVTLGTASTQSVTVGYSTSTGEGPTGATNGVDYNALSNLTLTFAPGETQKTITVQTVDDSEAEPTETFLVTLTAPINAAISRPQATGTINDNDSTSQLPGNVDGDADFDANDSFLIQLIKLSGTDTQINQSKGSSPLTATQIRANVTALQTKGDVDGDTDFDANDAFLIHLVKLSGTDNQINQSKGSSPLAGTQIRANVNALGAPAAPNIRAAMRIPTAQPLFAADAADETTPESAVSSILPTDHMAAELIQFAAPQTSNNLFAPDSESTVQAGFSTPNSQNAVVEAGFSSDTFRSWIDSI